MNKILRPSFFIIQELGFLDKVFKKPILTFTELFIELRNWQS